MCVHVLFMYAYLSALDVHMCVCECVCVHVILLVIATILLSVHTYI